MSKVIWKKILVTFLTGVIFYYLFGYSTNKNQGIFYESTQYQFMLEFCLKRPVKLLNFGEKNFITFSAMLFLDRIYWQGLESWLSSIFNWVKNCPGGFPTIFTQHFERLYDLHMTLSIYDILSESDIINLHDRRARLETNYESNFNIEDIMYLTFIRFTAPHIIFFIKN